MITRDEAQHIADHIKNTIHKDNYTEAYDELEAILGRLKTSQSTILTKLQAEIIDLRSELAKLKTPETPVNKNTVATTKKL